MNFSAVGGIPKRPTGTDCKSVDLSLHRFESCFPHDLHKNKFILYFCRAKKVTEQSGTSGSSSVGRAAAFQAAGRGFEPRLPLCTFRSTLRSESRRSSGVEYFLGKEGVTGSIPVVGSTQNLLSKHILKLKLRIFKHGKS